MNNFCLFQQRPAPPRDVSPDDDVGNFDVIVDDGDSDDVVPETPPPRRRGKSLTLTILMKAAPGYRRLQISQ